MTDGFKFPWPFPNSRSRIYTAKSYITMSLVKFVAKVLFIRGTNNKLIVKRRDELTKLLLDRSRPLITFSNHRCNIDDPLMWTFLSFREFLNMIDRQRYTLAAHDICFTKQWHTQMFSLGRCVPCVRGEGIYQQGINFCIEKLNENSWVHIFPEGKVCDAPKRFKWGIARMIMETKKPPLVLPIWVENMHCVWPTTKPYYPRFGYTVNMFVGEAIDGDWLRTKFHHNDEATFRKGITDFLQRKLFELGEKEGCLVGGTADGIERDDPTRSLYPR